jgi:DNA-binding transcriptional LysR family regulator
VTIANNLVQLRYVASVAREGSFSAAAKACGVRQPTISNAIAEIERHIGAQLFQRTTRGVELTPLGRDLVQHMEIVLSAAEDLDREVEALCNPEKKMLRLAFSPVLDSRVLTALGESFMSGHPGVEVIYKECTTDDLRARVYKHQVDVVIAPRVIGEGDWARCKLYSDRVRYVPRGGALDRPRPTVTLAEVAAQRLILTQPICGLAQTTRSWFERAGLAIEEYLGKAMTYPALKEWAEKGLGGALIPESKLAESASEYPLLVDEGEPVLLAYDAMWNQQLTFARHVRDFVRHLAKPSSKLFPANRGVWDSRAPAEALRVRGRAR